MRIRQTVAPRPIAALWAFIGGLCLVSSGCEQASPELPARAASSVSQPSESVAHDGIFPVTVTADVGGKPARLKLTGRAVRKAMLLKFYQIGSYCDESCSPTNVDELASADVPKQLCLTMERDIPANILSHSFRETFAKNDPDGKFADEIKAMLDYMLQEPLKAGQQVLITHLPKTGVSCTVGGEEPIVVANPAFAHVVWNVYMGPQGVSADLRKGLGSRLN